MVLLVPRCASAARCCRLLIVTAASSHVQTKHASFWRRAYVVSQRMRLELGVGSRIVPGRLLVSSRRLQSIRLLNAVRTSRLRMSSVGKRREASQHPYLSGNFAPVSKTCRPTPITYSGEIPKELHGGMYVRNGGNPISNDDLGREAHWFDGDGMLTGVWFDRSKPSSQQSTAHFVNQYILTDVCLSSFEHDALRTPILPSITTLVNPLSSLILIIWRILRSAFIVLLSHLPGSHTAIKRISVANTSILFHDGRALATCESGPPIRVQLPGLETVGWFDGNSADGEAPSKSDAQSYEKEEPGFGRTGLLSWMREWTTGHPKVDPTTGEMMLFHCNFTPPFVHYSVIPTTHPGSKTASASGRKMLNVPVPGCSGGKMMHDFGVSKDHTVILDLPLTLTPFNLLQNKPVVAYEPEKPARFGVFPRHDPSLVRWFETSGCCILHTANTWDEYGPDGTPTAVNMLACRLTSASLVFSAGNIAPPPHPNHKELAQRKRMSFFAKYDEDEEAKDPEKMSSDETAPLLPRNSVLNSSNASPSPPISDDDEEQCRLYYYRFSMPPADANPITHQFALSAIPLEFPTVSPHTDMKRARYIYGCSVSIASFGAALGKAAKIDIIARIDVETLLARASKSPPQSITGCVDNRNIHDILASTDPHDPIKAFRLPPKHFAQEARFVPKGWTGSPNAGHRYAEEEGYLLFYVFDESQLDEHGECAENATSELWVLDAKSMQRVVVKVHLPTRVPYGLHGNWFTEGQIRAQREVERLRSMPQRSKHTTTWGRVKRRLIGALG